MAYYLVGGYQLDAIHALKLYTELQDLTTASVSDMAVELVDGIMQTYLRQMRANAYNRAIGRQTPIDTVRFPYVNYAFPYLHAKIDVYKQGEQIVVEILPKGGHALYYNEYGVPERVSKNIMRFPRYGGLTLDPDYSKIDLKTFDDFFLKDLYIFRSKWVSIKPGRVISGSNGRYGHLEDIVRYIERLLVDFSVSGSFDDFYNKTMQNFRDLNVNDADKRVLEEYLYRLRLFYRNLKVKVDIEVKELVKVGRGAGLQIKIALPKRSFYNNPDIYGFKKIVQKTERLYLLEKSLRQVTEQARAVELKVKATQKELNRKIANLKRRKTLSKAEIEMAIAADKKLAKLSNQNIEPLVKNVKKMVNDLSRRRLIRKL